MNTIVTSSDVFDTDGPESSVSDYFALLKPRVMTLVVFTGVVGMVLAPNTAAVHPFLQLLAIACIALGSGAAGAINMWYDRDIDVIMERTRNRPIPAGRMVPEEALAFGVILSVASVSFLGLATNWLAAGWLLAAILFYTVIYTVVLKRRTPQNIVIGGGAGAFPPIIGWTAITGDMSLEPCLLFLITFMWTPPHFWALALYKSDDYARAGVPMLPVTHGQKSTRYHILVYTLLLTAVTLLPYVFGMVGEVYMAGVILLNARFLWHAVSVLKSDDDRVARSMFFFSMIYLLLVYLLWPVDVVFRGGFYALG